MVCWRVCSGSGMPASISRVWPGCPWPSQPSTAVSEQRRHGVLLAASLSNRLWPPFPFSFWTGNDLARSAALSLTSITYLSACNVLIYSKCYFPGSFYSFSLPCCSHILRKNHLEPGYGTGFYHIHFPVHEARWQCYCYLFIKVQNSMSVLEKCVGVSGSSATEDCVQISSYEMSIIIRKD